MLICIDAGHCLNTPGKRCLKSIDPSETREWTLNNRIAERVEEKLSAYRCQTMRLDDVTGATEVSLERRVAVANGAGADVYLSIHHNAGIRGGAGGGIAVYVHPEAGESARTLQRAVYERVMERTGLRGNRVAPLAEANLYVLRRTKMPAILGEFGFMDSTTDTPVILTENFAEQTARGIAEALVQVYQLEEKEMTGEEIRAIVREELERMEAERSARPASGWAEQILQQAKSRGITDASRPQAYATRQEVAAMVNAAMK